MARDSRIGAIVLRPLNVRAPGPENDADDADDGDDADVADDAGFDAPAVPGLAPQFGQNAASLGRGA